MSDKSKSSLNITDFYSDFCIADFYKTAGLLKKRPAGQIGPATPLKVARDQALIKLKYRPNDTCHVCTCQ